MGDLGYAWPPLIFWPKWRFPKHPREARTPGDILLWRSAKALDVVTEHLGPIVPPISAWALEIPKRHSANCAFANWDWRTLCSALPQRASAADAPRLGD